MKAVSSKVKSVLKLLKSNMVALLVGAGLMAGVYFLFLQRNSGSCPACPDCSTTAKPVLTEVVETTKQTYLSKDDIKAVM